MKKYVVPAALALAMAVSGWAGAGAGQGWKGQSKAEGAAACKQTRSDDSATTRPYGHKHGKAKKPGKSAAGQQAEPKQAQ